MNEFLQRLKQRKLVQWGIAYVAAAFALLQGIDIVAQRFGWPEQTMRFVIIVLSLGLFVTMVLAWYHGERGAQRINGTELLILALLLAIGGGFLWRFGGVARAPSVTSAAIPASMPAPSISEKSIAVLPFENLSSDKENSYFTDGVQDEILSDLAKVADLKVISRTSTVQYKTGVARNLREIGQQLGVANLLEGSVQRAGNKVRVNAQLIDARTDAHLWAQVYDRPLDDVFAIQSEIAQAIADQLQAKLSPKEEAAVHARPTKDMVAYDLYLRAKEITQSQSYHEAEERRAVVLLDDAVTRDPFFVAAFCLLAQIHLDLYWTNHDHTPVRLELATKALNTAARLDPDRGEVHLARARLYYHGHRDYAGALRELALARRSLPNDSTVALTTGAIERRQGQLAEATSHMEQAARLDPRNSSVVDELALTYTLGLRHYADGRRVLDQLLLWQPNNSSAAWRRAQIDYWQSGDLRRKRAFLAEPVAKAADPNELAR
ncbi:MAG: FlgO family outer membrane protein, partial [Candidatus Eremiobacteraeota bacterium]|nr:FlgO family outer membrane protein [Candidatus Eremiobacteraeota bacterium]